MSNKPPQQNELKRSHDPYDGPSNQISFLNIYRYSKAIRL